METQKMVTVALLHARLSQGGHAYQRPAKRPHACILSAGMVFVLEARSVTMEAWYQMTDVPPLASWSVVSRAREEMGRTRARQPAGTVSCHTTSKIATTGTG